jgi:hypothetical protein
MRARFAKYVYAKARFKLTSTHPMSARNMDSAGLLQKLAVEQRRKESAAVKKFVESRCRRMGSASITL